jgi:hypothetical protein
MFKTMTFWGAIFGNLVVTGVLAIFLCAVTLPFFGITGYHRSWPFAVTVAFALLLLFYAMTAVRQEGEREKSTKKIFDLTKQIEGLQAKQVAAESFIHIFVDEERVDVVLARFRKALNSAMEETTEAGRTLFASPLTDPGRMASHLYALNGHHATLQQRQSEERTARQLALDHGFVRKFPDVPRVQDVNSLGGSGYQQE